MRVDNVAPTITAATLSSYAVPKSAAVTPDVTVTDPGNDVAKVAITWGDGTAAEDMPCATGAKPCGPKKSHSYANVGVYALSATATDADNAASAPVSFPRQLVVYDDASPVLSVSASVTVSGGTMTVSINKLQYNGGGVTSADLKIKGPGGLSIEADKPDGYLVSGSRMVVMGTINKDEDNVAKRAIYTIYLLDNGSSDRIRVRVVSGSGTVWDSMAAPAACPVNDFLGGSCDPTLATTGTALKAGGYVQTSLKGNSQQRSRRLAL